MSGFFVGAPDLCRSSVPRSVLLHAGDVGVAIGWATGALTFPNHLAQAIHGLVVGQVQRIAAVRQQLHRLPDAPGLINAALLADGQVHGQVQERVALAFFSVLHGGQGGVDIGQIGVVFGVLVNPQACYGFNSLKRLTSEGFGINRTEKMADIRLGG